MDGLAKKEHELASEVREYVVDRMESREIRGIDLASRTHLAMGLSDSGARSFVSNIRNYSILYHIKKNQGLSRLSVLLYGLGTPEEDPIIQKLKNTYESFNYPPGICEDVTQRIEEEFKEKYVGGEVERLVAFTEKFRKLTPSDAEFVENLVDRLS